MGGHARSRTLNHQVTVGRALPDDEAALRAVLQRAVVPGSVRVAFTREPHYGAGEGLAGGEDQTVVARCDGHVVGMGQSTVHILRRNGSARRIGYLGLLRLERGTPGGVRLLRDGYAMLLAEMARSGVDACFTSIADDNARARRVLEHGRKVGLPAYTPLASLITFVAPVSRHWPDGESGEDPASRVDAAELTRFLQHQSRLAHLTLAWEPPQWAGLARHGVDPADFVVVRNAGVIIGAGAVWDQRPFRQTVVDGYAGVLHVVRPLVNAARTLRGAPPLPAPGSVLAQGAVVGASVADGAADGAAWPALWRGLCRRAVHLGLSWLVLSRDARDPDVAVLRHLLRAREYRTTLYNVALGVDRLAAEPWDSRPFRPEVGLL